MGKVLLSNAPWTVLGYKKNGKPIYAIAGGADDDFSFDGAGGPAGGYDGGNGAALGGEGANPAWNDLLADLPQELHEKITPKLKELDTKFNSRLQTVHQQYESWKPIQQLAGNDPQAAEFALQLMNALNANPREVWDNLGQYYQFSGQPTPQTQGGQGQEPSAQDDPFAPINQQMLALQEQNRTMANIMLAQREQEEAANADAWVESELARAKAAFPDVDIPDKWLLAGLQAGQDVSEAAKEYAQTLEKAAATYRPRPLIMGSGGGVPGSQIDPSKLDSSQTKNLVVQMMQAANAQRR